MPKLLMHGRSSSRGIWEGRDWRSFRSAVISPTEVAALVREELALRTFAHTLDPGD